MNTINTTAWANLKKNKGRNILTGIAILLTTFLIFTITTLGSGMIRLQFEAANQLYPAYHFMYRSVSEKTAEDLSHHADIAALGLRQDTAEIVLENARCHLIYLDKTGIELGKLDLEDGRFPSSGDDMAISEGMLQELGLSAKIGDTITLSFQPIEAGGLGYEQQKTFTICGILPTPEAEDDTAYYSALVSRDFVEETLRKPDRLYRTMIRLQNPEGMTTNDILYKAESIARTFSIPEENISENTAYLVANYIDPAFYTTLIGILIVVALAGIITIYSIYYVSTMYKVQEYGKLKALGATQRQVKAIVFKEGIFTAAFAVSPGIILGMAASLGGLSFLLNSFARDDILGNTLKDIYGNGEFDLFQTWIYIFAIIMALCTTAISLLRPVHIAGRISPVEAMRYDGLGVSPGRTKSRKGYEDVSLFRLMKANLSRNKKRTLITLVSLSITGILFLGVSTILSCANPEEIAHDEIMYDLDLSIYSVSGDRMRPEYDWRSIQQRNPLDDSLMLRIGNMSGVSSVISHQNTSVLLQDVYDGDSLRRTSISGIPRVLAGTMEASVIEGNVTYDELLDGNKIILNKKAFIWSPDWKVGSMIRMIVQDGEKEIPMDFQVAAIADPPVSLYHYSAFMLPSSVLEEICSNNQTNRFSIAVEKEKLNPVEESLRAITDENPFLKLHTFEETKKEQEELTAFLSAVCYIFLAVLGSICIMNLINTMVNSVYVRRRELGMMQALGLSEKQLFTLFQMEGLFYTLGTLLLSLVFGSIAGFLFFRCARDTGFLSIVSFHYPFAQTLLLFLVIMIVQFGLTWILARNFRKQSIIERIKFSA